MAAKKSARKHAKAASKVAKSKKGRKSDKPNKTKEHHRRLAEAITTIVEFGMAGEKCTPENICKHLKKLGEWLDWFEMDYTRLRVAVCNVERMAWNEGTATVDRRFCHPGSGTEPDVPKKPPIWT